MHRELLTVENIAVRTILF